jgi:hypothetical protein
MSMLHFHRQVHPFSLHCTRGLTKLLLEQK